MTNGGAVPETPNDGRIPLSTASASAKPSSGHARARWTVGLLASTAVVAIAGVISNAHGVGTMSRVLQGGILTASEANPADDRQFALGMLELGLILATGVAWLVWQHRAHANLWALEVPGLRFTPGWAVGWWFIPFASLWMPYRAVSELWRASEVTLPQRGSRRKKQPLLGLWWGSLLVSWVVFPTIALIVPDDTIDQLLMSFRLAVVGQVATLAAALLAILVVRRIDERQLATAAHVTPAGDEPSDVALTSAPTGARSRTALVGVPVLASVVVIGAALAYAAGKSPPGQVTGPRPSVGPAELPNGWTLHEDPAGFSLGLPPGWKIQPPEPDVDLFALDPTSGAGVVVATERLPEGITLLQYAELTSDAILKSVQTNKSGEDQEVALPAGPAIRIMFDSTFDRTKVTQVIYVLRIDAIGCVVVFSAEPGSFGNNEPIFDQVLHSVRLTESSP